MRYASSVRVRLRRKKEGTMKMAKELKSDMRKEYDFSNGKRGRYAGRIKPNDTAPKNCKVDVLMSLDADIIEFFRQRASLPGAESYKKQINSALRSFMESEGELISLSSLLNNDLFIRAIAEKVKAL